MASDQGTATFALIDGVDAADTALGDGTQYDIAAAAADGGGTIVTDDERLIVALRAHHGVTEVTEASAPRGRSKSTSSKGA
jgi:hypothetical protein